ncbi:hypothetical protein, partial [Acetobacter malorum]|uniref:hypothetical protein n=1 Tax=Acetobacter malorum TaxID=178901 RepID=UPI001E29C848
QQCTGTLSSSGSFWWEEARVLGPIRTVPNKTDRSRRGDRPAHRTNPAQRVRSAPLTGRLSGNRAGWL